MKGWPAACVALLWLAACASSQDLHGDDKVVAQKITDQIEQQHQFSRQFIKDVEYAYIGGEAIKLPETLPSFMSLPVYYRTNVPTAATEVASSIARQTNVPILMDGLKPFALEYSGNLKGLCDAVADLTGSAWKVVDGRILFQSTLTRTFAVAELPGTDQHEAALSISSGVNASSGGVATPSAGSVGNGSGGIKNKETVNRDVWSELRNSAVVVAGAGAQVFVNPSLGSVTVIGSPASVANVGEWINTINEGLSAQVELELTVYNVQMTHENNYGLSPLLVLQNALSSSQFHLAGVPVPVSQAGSSVGTASVNILSQGAHPSRWSGSSGVVSALATLGSVTTLYEKTEITKSGHAVVSQVGQSQSYVASVSSTVAANVGENTALNAAVLNTGFNTYLLPRVVNAGIHLAVVISSSDLQKLDQFSSGGNSIQEPTILSSDIQDDVVLKPGEALLVTAFNASTSHDNHSGTLSPFNPLLGGGLDQTRSRQMIAVVVTANRIR